MVVGLFCRAFISIIPSMSTSDVTVQKKSHCIYIEGEGKLD